MSEQRKKDHIELTFKSRPKRQIELGDLKYEPILSAHPSVEDKLTTKFMGHTLELPLWVSSMTGGTEQARTINQNLAKACGEFKFGMGLGSCRSLLSDNSRFEDFNIRPFMGDAPLFTNFGIAQLEELIDESKLDKVSEITKSLEANGVIIHVNPLQEWMQPEGDRFKKAPLETIKRCLDDLNFPIIVKEVGQGFGPKSLKALSELPLGAIELAGFGGTNFTMLEQARLSGVNSGKKAAKNSFTEVGHTCIQMIDWINEFDQSTMKCQNFIISGGIVDPVQGYALMNKLKHKSIFGMASSLLKYSMNDYDELKDYILGIQDGLKMAQSYLRG
ncbi:MAG: isopentenyl-diphosphate delta-isomerase [Bacteriovoracaceae bacterium]|jgi:isopentenyl-diphosphate delta-isomerase